jgi:hypothetical protein
MSTDDPGAFLPRRWFTAGTNLELWGQAGTYKAVPYDALPPLPGADHHEGSFAWLRDAPLSPHGLDFGDAASGCEASEAETERRLAGIVAQASALGLTVPAALVAFIGHPELHRRVPSCTACYLDVPTKLVELPGHPGRLLRFMNDQQCCLLWYVLLEPGGGHCVVVAAPDFDDDAVGDTLEDVARPRDVAVCAPSFEAFMHRFWLENALWFAVSKRQPLSPEQRAYAESARRLATS